MSTLIEIIQAINIWAPGDFPWEDILCPALASLAYRLSSLVEAAVRWLT